MKLNLWDKVCISYPKRDSNKIVTYTIINKDIFDLLHKKRKLNWYKNNYLEIESTKFKILSKYKMYVTIPVQAEKKAKNKVYTEEMVIVDIFPNTNIIKPFYYKSIIKCKKWYSSILKMLKRR